KPIADAHRAPDVYALRRDTELADVAAGSLGARSGRRGRRARQPDARERGSAESILVVHRGLVDERAQWLVVHGGPVPVEHQVGSAQDRECGRLAGQTDYERVL